MKNIDEVLQDRETIPQITVQAPRAPEALHRFAKAISACAFIPLATDGAAFEHVYWAIAGLVVALVWALAAWLWACEPRAWTRRLGYAAAGAILLQAVPCFGEIAFCLILCVTQATSPWFQSRAAAGAGALWKSGAVAAAAVFLQIFGGTLLRQTSQGFMLHSVWAAAVMAAVLLASTRGLNARRDCGLMDPSSLLSLLVTAQTALGYAAYRGGAFAAATHRAVGALLLAATLVWTLRARRCR